MRQPFFAGQEFGELVFAGALALLAGAKEERVKRLKAMAAKVPDGNRCIARGAAAGLDALGELFLGDAAKRAAGSRGEAGAAAEAFLSGFRRGDRGGDLVHQSHQEPYPGLIGPGSRVAAADRRRPLRARRRAYAFPGHLRPGKEIGEPHMGRLFGTDGIRGEANRYPMDAATAFAVGQAITRVLKRNGHVPRVIIGKDTRISGYMLESALESGVTSMGGYAYLVGVMPTPAIAYLTESMRADAGLVISASHNPYHDNGIKVVRGQRLQAVRRAGSRDRGAGAGRQAARDGAAAAGHGEGQAPGGRPRTLRGLPQEHLPARPHPGRA